MNVVKIYGSNKHHLTRSMISSETVCGKTSVYWEHISPDPRKVELDFCLKCWAYIGKQTVRDFLNLNFFEKYDNFQKSSLKETPK